MSSILDIDLDYFAILDNPFGQLNDLLKWGNLRVAFSTDRHHHVLRKWKSLINNGVISTPTFILHVDEHHDMMDERQNPNIANWVYHAMTQWPECQVHWLVDCPIDYPEMWLGDDAWKTVSRRFSYGAHRPHYWPKPEVVTICTSPEFINSGLRHQLLKQIELWNEGFA